MIYLSFTVMLEGSFCHLCYAKFRQNSSTKMPVQYNKMPLSGNCAITFDFRAVEELSKVPKSTLLRLFRLYYLDFIIFDIQLDLLNQLLDAKDKKSEAEMFRRKEGVLQKFKKSVRTVFSIVIKPRGKYLSK